VRGLTRQERRAQTRKALLDAAAKVFVQHGLHGSTVEEISAEAGFTRGAFYSNFDSKEQLFIELLQDRVYSRYRAMTEQALADVDRAPTPRQTGELLAAIQAHPDNEWLFRLWLECLAQATRDEEVRELVATFWRGNRALIAELVRRGWPEHTDRARSIANALIALDIGLSIQHFVDRDDVALDEYPELYELLFEPLRKSARDTR
jgi:AcrR family transcriptional regulator